MEPFFEKTELVAAYDVDFHNQLKLSTLFNFLQNTAALHADSLHLGYDDLIKHKLAWVLSWIKVEIFKSPQFGETIKIKTWPKCKFKLYSVRDFIVSDLNDNILYKVSTAWLPINVETKRITDPAKLPSPIPYQEEDSAIEELPQKLKIFPGQNKLFSHTVGYSDIDLNQHVNNTKYVEMISNCYDIETYKNRQIKSITISFISESFFSNLLDIFISSDASVSGIDTIEAKNVVTSKPVFHALINWRN